MVRSMTLASISILPSSRKWLRPAQRERVADGLDRLGFLPDEGWLLSKPWLEGVDDRMAACLAGTLSSAERPWI